MKRTATFLLLLGICALASLFLYWKFGSAGRLRPAALATPSRGGSAKLPWHSPEITRMPSNAEGTLIRYGRALVANTGWYFGPSGKISTISNGMNCQNCHLEAGTRLYANNFSAVFSTYPKFKPRSGTVENIFKRINDCMERSLNAKKLDTSSMEMRAIASYVDWVGGEVPRGFRPEGAGVRNLDMMDSATNPDKGRQVYIMRCQVCHGMSGEGVKRTDSPGYTYPPLWGEHSYTTAAGMFRISLLADFVKDNMPFGATHGTPQLTDEEAWDVAAYVNSQPRPEKKFANDWPDLNTKPVDLPYGPYADGFSQQQHKYGPYKPILASVAKKGERF